MSLQAALETISKLRGKRLYAKATEPDRSLCASMAHTFEATSQAIETHTGIQLTQSQKAAALALIHNTSPELDTGEGKTYALMLAAGVLALNGVRVHLLTSNEYLVERDALHASFILQNLGINASYCLSSMSESDKRCAYQSDIVYLTPSCVAFDLLRDERVTDSKELVVTQFPDMALIDEMDTLLLDESSVPFVLSEPESELDMPWGFFVQWISGCSFEGGDPELTFDKDLNRTFLTESGYRSLEMGLIRHGIINSPSQLYARYYSSLLAMAYHFVYAYWDLCCNKDYLVKNEKVHLISETTGRIDPSRRWSGGLHQAVEVKHGLEPTRDTVAQSRMTVDTLLLRYHRFSGTSGTLIQASEVFLEAYGVHTVKIPSSFSQAQVISKDRVFRTSDDLDKALVDLLKDTQHRRLQPVLIGVNTVGDAYHCHELLCEHGLSCALLTADNEKEEAAIIARSGLPGAITVATSMAGRGTDIKIGGDDGSLKECVMAAGGLKVIGYSRLANKRMDDQLVGRSGRRDEPGDAEFWISLSEERFKQLKIDCNAVPAEGLVATKKHSRAIDNEQLASQDSKDTIHDSFSKIHQSLSPQHALYFDARSTWLKFDDQQFFAHLSKMILNNFEHLLYHYEIYHKTIEFRDIEGLVYFLQTQWRISVDVDQWLQWSLECDSEDILNRLRDQVVDWVNAAFGQNTRGRLSHALLPLFNQFWSSHMSFIDHAYSLSLWQEMGPFRADSMFSFWCYEGFEQLIQSTEQAMIQRFWEMADLLN